MGIRHGNQHIIADSEVRSLRVNVGKLVSVMHRGNRASATVSTFASQSFNFLTERDEKRATWR
jgi:hypothetical protein